MTIQPGSAALQELDGHSMLHLDEGPKFSFTALPGLINHVWQRQRALHLGPRPLCASPQLTEKAR